MKNRFKLLSFLLALFLLLGVIPVNAFVNLESGTCGENVTWTLDVDGLLTISGTGAMFDYGSAYSNSAPWGGSDDKANRVKTVVINNGVTSIGNYAFYRCTGLTSVTIPNSVTSIGSLAFFGCKSLTSATIPDGVTSIGQDAFYNCKSLTSVTIPSGVTIIEYSTFKFCAGLTSVTIPNGVTKIDEAAFCDCTGLTSVTIGNGVKSIGVSAFQGCTGLTNVTIPDNVTSIGRDAFNGCTGLTDVTIQNGVKSIWISAFEGCTSLTNVTIPNSVESIGSNAFDDTAWYNAWYNAQPDGLLYIGKVAYKYKGVMPENTAIRIKAGTLGIAGDAFFDCKGLTSVTIPDSVTNIGMGAFHRCTGLTSVTIPNSVTFIGIDAFFNCTGLTGVMIPNSVTEIGYSAFEGCTSLSYIIIPSSVTSIGYDAVTDNTVIYGKARSYAQTWAEENDRTFEIIGDPSVPQNVTAKPTANRTITVSWSAVFGATQYNIYRYNSVTKSYGYKGTTFATEEKPTQYIDRNLTAGATYSYKVVAVDKLGDETLVSDMSDAASAKVVGRPAVPTGVAGRATAGRTLTVSWKAVPGATQYNIYRYNGATKSYAYKGTTFATAANPTQYVDSGLNVGTTYYYKVVAVTKDEGLTLISDQSAFASAKVVGTPAIPAGIAVKPSAEKTLTVSWTAGKNATQYNIYRYNGSTKSYVYKGTTFATAANPTQYIDSGLSAGTSYYYRVVAVMKDAGLTFVSDKSAAGNAKVLGTPKAPETVASSAAAGKITVFWTESAGATQYNIYRYNGAKKAYVYKGTSYGTNFADTTVAAGTTYYYRVVAVTKGSGLTFVSGYSAYTSAKAK